jgi:hypothetical protein
MDELMASVDREFEDGILIGQRRPWWEEMVRELQARYGWVSLS